MKRKTVFLLLVFLAASVAAEDALPYWAIGPFSRPKANPIIEPDTTSLFFCPMSETQVRWECADTFNPAAVVKDGKICILYRAEDNPSVGIGRRTSRIGLAETKNGVRVKRRATPVMYPDTSQMSRAYEWTGGTEDPRVVEAEVDGKRMYVMTYTSWNRKTARLSVATSEDLLTWHHHGPVFQHAYDGRFNKMFCKSGSIVTEIRDGRLVAAKILVGGKQRYFMYWGEYWVCGAVSDDLINWEPILDEKGELLYLAKPRRGFFDSQLTECGPPAVKTPHGIVLLYNGKNLSGNKGDTNFAAATYAAGQMLFSNSDPLKLLDRLDKPFFYPVADFEKSGQYAAGTVFIEGLVYHRKKFYLYYGCADSKVGVAVCKPRKTTRSVK